MPTRISPSFFVGTKPIAIVVGGAGFLGSHICEDLLEKQVKVLCIDNSEEGIVGNINHLIDSENFLLIKRGVNKKIPLGIQKLNYVIHVANLESYLSSEEITLENLELKNKGIKRYLKFAKKHDAKFVLVTPERVLPETENKQSSNLSHQETKKFAEALVREYAQLYGVNTRIARVGDLYGPRMKMSGISPVNLLIKYSLEQAALKVPPSYAVVVYPTFVVDASEGIVRTLFSPGTKDKTFTILGRATTLNEVIQTIKFLGYPLALKVDNIISFPIEWGRQVFVDSTTIWETQTLLKDGLSKAFSWAGSTRKLQKIEHAPVVPIAFKDTAPIIKPPEVKNPEPIKEVSKTNFWAVLEKKTEEVIVAQKPKYLWQKTVIAMLLILPFFWVFGLPFFELGLGLASLSFAKNEIVKGESVNAQNWSGNAEYLFKLSSGGFDQWKVVPGLGEKAEKLSSETRLLATVAGTAKSLSLALDTGQILTQKITSEESSDLTADIEKLAVELKSVEKQLAFLEPEIGKSFVLEEINKRVGDKKITKENLAVWRRSTAGFAETLPSLPEILGADKKKTYLILFQNNAELRPTGGFIGSFGLVNFDKGRIVNLDVFDVYTADGQLKGHVEPPQPIKDYLGEGAWYLRDSNWSPDFPTSAARASWFLDKEMGYKADGVIAVDLEFLRYLLRESGPITLADFNEELTHLNFYEKIQSQAEKEFFPGSTNKKDYLTALSKTLLNNIVESPRKYLPALSQAVINSLDERHMSFWFENQKTNQLFAKHGWDGSIAAIPCKLLNGQNTCSSDYLQIVEANLGVNKSNNFIERKYSMEMTVGQDKISHRLVISYKNNSIPGVWPGGDYKNYIRLYTNSGSRAINQPVLVSAGGKEEFLTFEESQEKGKKVFGSLLLVPAGETRQFIATWESSVGLSTEQSKSGSLMFYWQKQAGVGADPASIKLNLPTAGTGGVVSAFPMPTLTQTNTIEYNTSLARDFVTNLIWQHKNTN